MAGTTGSISNGGDAAMSRLLGVQSFGVAVQQPRQVNVEGDDGVQAVFFFEPNTLPNGDMALGVLNVNLVAQAQGTKVYADGDHDVINLQPEDFDFNELSILINSQAKSRASGSSGASGFLVVHYPKIQLVPLGQSGLTQAAATGFTHAMIANKSSIYGWGFALTEGNEGTTAAVSWGPAYSENRVTLHAFTGDGSTTNFTLGQTPAAESANKIKAWQDGTALVYGGGNDFTVSGTTLTFEAGSIPAAGEKVVVRYEYS